MTRTIFFLNLIVAASYTITGKLGLLAPFYNTSVTLIWPPAGIALAALLLGGVRLWPGVALGAFLTNITTGDTTLFTALGITTGNTLMAIAGWRILYQSRWAIQTALTRLKDLFPFLIFAVLIIPMISATIGSLTLLLSGIPNFGFFSAWFGWWFGDAMGILLLGAPILTYGTALGQGWRPKRFTESLALTLVTIITGYTVFGYFSEFSVPLIHLIFPLVIWAALRLKQRGVTLLTLLVAIMAFFATAQGHGPFALDNWHDSLLYLLSFFGLFSGAAMILAAMMYERREAHSALDHARQVLEDRVEERTEALLKSNEQFRDLNARLSSLIQALPDFVCFKKLDGKIIEVNRSFEVLTHRSRAELVGTYEASALPPDLARHCRVDDQQVIETGKTVVSIVQMREQSGATRHMETLRAPILEDDGSLIGLVSVVRDITARKQAEKRLQDSEARQRAILNAAMDAIITIDHLGNVVAFNPAAEQTFGYKNKDAVGQSISELIVPAELRARHENGLARMAATNISTILDQRIEMPALRADGSQFPVEMTITAIKIDDQRFFTAYLHDITDRKQAQESLVARKMAEAASKAKSAFLASMSHEIRSPMNAIIGMTDLALQTKMTPIQHQYMDIVQQSAESLLALINDILDFSKIEANRLSLEIIQFDLLEIVEKSCSTVAVQAHKKNLELLYDIHPAVPLYLEGDPNRLRQILVNLLSNAVKFTQYGEIILRIELDEDTASNSENEQNVPQPKTRLHFSVSDTGIGISSDKLDIIFQRFSQAESHTNRKFGGSGLGLTISRQLTDLMQGTMWVESTIGRGSVFHFTAYFGVFQDEQAQAIFTQYADLTGRQILLAENNIHTRTILKRTLSMCGAIVTDVESGQQAMDIITKTDQKGNHFDLMIFDCRMPDIGGMEVASSIKESTACIDNTVIILPTSHRKNDMPRCKELEISGTLIKPVNRTLMLRMISRLLHGDEETPSDQATVVRSLNRIQPHGSFRILLVEDNQESQRLASEILVKKNHSVIIAPNGHRAIEQLSKEPFDLVLMDVSLPEMDGIEVTRTIRASSVPNANIPIIGISAHALDTDRKQCIQAGMDDYLTKPYRMDDLINIIETVMSSESASHKRIRDEIAKRAQGAVLKTSIDDQSARQAFLEHSSTLMRTITHAVEQRDYATLESTLLELRDASKAIGAEQIKTAALRLTLIARKAQPDLLANGLEKLELTVQEVHKILDGII
ncbi:MAG: PAS domain S-box protein [Magnetococcales bacterium]|nr:PAS domain S-box protein [Magnetococcales bacterium]